MVCMGAGEGEVVQQLRGCAGHIKLPWANRISSTCEKVLENLLFDVSSEQMAQWHIGRRIMVSAVQISALNKVSKVTLLNFDV